MAMMKMMMRKTRKVVEKIGTVMTKVEKTVEKIERDVDGKEDREIERRKRRWEEERRGN